MLDFKPMFTPYEMLELGIFDGSYYLDTNPDFDRKPTITKSNLFMPNASQPLSVWQENGWITEEDPMGWFQWYLRYYQGRRLDDLDAWQIKRQKSFVARHGAQVRKNAKHYYIGEQILFQILILKIRSLTLKIWYNK